jgi:SNF2 family DNA or RNA helicase
MSLEWLAEYQQAWNDYIATLPARFGDLTEKQLKKKLENITELQKLIENSKIAQVNSKWKAKRIMFDLFNKAYGEERIIIFTGFIETYELLIDLCKAMGISYNIFENVADFKKGNEQVLIGRIKAHGKGGNIPEASVTLFTDMDWVCSNNLQAENRMDRPEQTKEMKVVYYLTKNEDVDTHIREINKEKTRHIEEFMRPLCEEELLVLPSKLSDLQSKFYKEFQLLS